MAVDHVKSATIIDLDATPAVFATSGKGAAGYIEEISGHAVALASSSVDATYQLVRVRSNCQIKDMTFESAAQTAGKFDIGLYYATDGQGGKPAALLAAAAIDQDFFASVIDCASAVARTDIVNESGTYTIDKRTQPLWQAVGLTSDPGGCFDIVATVVTTAVTTGTGRFGISVKFTS